MASLTSSSSPFALSSQSDGPVDLTVELEQGRATGLLHLSSRWLFGVPPAVFRLGEVLVRLDLGWNELEAVPTEVGELKQLQQLWLNDNPLVTVPPEIEKCGKLQVMDLRRTRVRKLPREIGRLRALFEIALEGTKLKPKQDEAFRQGGTEGLVWHLRKRDTMKQLKIELEANLRDGIYREVSDGEEATLKIKALVKSAFREFTEYDEIKNLIRNAERLFPADLDEASAAAIRVVFVQLKRENAVKKLAAELELKLRCIYFDAIRPESVEGIVRGIYEHITVLEDVQFLIRHAPEIFPPLSKDIDPRQVRDDMVAVQERLAAERAAAIKGLETALRAIYSHVDPPLVEALAEAVAAAGFKKVEELKELTADASVFFPSEFESANPQRIRKAFRVAQAPTPDVVE